MNFLNNELLITHNFIVVINKESDIIIKGVVNGS